jgi:hypothetical protein
MFFFAELAIWAKQNGKRSDGKKERKKEKMEDNELFNDNIFLGGSLRGTQEF